MANLEVGMKAPDFRLPASTGGEFSLDQAHGKWVVLYFYPKDDTPGCTKEACNFRDRLKDYEAEGALIYGVSKDSISSHNRFVEKYNLPFPLLSDESCEMIKDYGVMKEKSMFGKSFLGVVRTTFLIDPEGKIAKIWKNVKVDGHHEEVLKTIEELKQA